MCWFRKKRKAAGGITRDPGRAWRVLADPQSQLRAPYETKIEWGGLVEECRIYVAGHLVWTVVSDPLLRTYAARDTVTTDLIRDDLDAALLEAETASKQARELARERVVQGVSAAAQERREGRHD
ncbi:UNVERIFIED_CONTAM: hypothetical protein BEN50_12810 [Euhalothece sp. KZN 001]